MREKKQINKFKKESPNNGSLIYTQNGISQP